MPKVILVAGRKRSGKDAFAKILQDEATLQGKTSEVMSFADPMKDIMRITLGITAEELDALKNNTDRPHRGYLQRFGNDAMKPYFGDKVWFNMLCKKIDNSTADIVIVPDFRFAEERVPGAMAINMYRPSLGANTDTHSSENGLVGFEFDVTVRNDGTLANLIPQARRIVQM